MSWCHHLQFGTAFLNASRSLLRAPELSTSSFKHLLSALESPLEFVLNPPSQELAVPQPFVASTLSCDLVINLAKNGLAEIWDGNALPAPEGSDTEDRTHPSAICAIMLAHRYSIPDILRRVFYELLSSQAFWDALGPRALQSALDALRIPEEGRPHAPRGARESWGALAGVRHAGAWRSFVVDKGALEVCDPLRFDFIAEWEGELKKEGKWCQARTIVVVSDM
ncbi:hypothetical protein V8D89_007053 [Ganoderma adspersum]